jgi:hypothetical protein
MRLLTSRVLAAALCAAGSAATSGLLGGGAVAAGAGSFEQAPSASRIKPVCRPRQVLNIRFKATMKLRFRLSSASFDHCCGHRIKRRSGLNVKQRTRQPGTFLYAVPHR